MGKRAQTSPDFLAFDPADPLPPEDTPSGRILRATRQHLFTFGYNSFTMDDLAHELGMSKKTLYVHFPSKDAIVDTIVDCMVTALRSRLELITTNRALSFMQKLAGVIETIGTVLSRATPHLLRDLQRFVPATYAKMESVRAENVPLYFGRLIREGIACGRVRSDVDPEFATQFWLQAIRGLVQPSVLELTHLSPKQTLEKAVHLFFGGLLTPTGRTDYEKFIASRNHRQPAT